MQSFNRWSTNCIDNRTVLDTLSGYLLLVQSFTPGKMIFVSLIILDLYNFIHYVANFQD